MTDRGTGSDPNLPSLRGCNRSRLPRAAQAIRWPTPSAAGTPRGRRLPRS